MKWTAIIIDDEPFIRDVINALGHWDELEIDVVGEASDGVAGIELVKQLAPDIVITDVKMPRLDGLGLAAELNTYDNPPQIIIVSGYDDFELVRQALKCGVSDYLLKPIKEDELNEQLAACTAEAAARERRLSIRRKWAPNPDYGKWLDDFRLAQKQIGDLLHGSDIAALAERFEQLAESTSSAGGLPETIHCYYALMEQLQQYASENGSSVKELCGEKGFGYVFGTGDDIKEALGHVCRLYCAAATEVQRRARQRGRLDMGLVKKYIDENVDKNLSLQLVSDHFHVSREYLSRSFKAEYEVSFSEYLFSRRMERARELIVDYRVPIKDAWQMLHFVDQTHFYKCFKRYFGKAPGEMRAKSSFDNRRGHE